MAEGRSPRDINLFMAKLARQANRYDDMVDFMIWAVAEEDELNEDDRNLLAVGFVYVTTAARRARHVVVQAEKTEKVRNDNELVVATKDLREKIESNITTSCHRFLGLLNLKRLPPTTTADEMIIYYKLQGDFYRYLGEFFTGDDFKGATARALDAYVLSQDIARELYPPTHNTRLCLVLNISVFYYDCLKTINMACVIAQRGYDEAIEHESYTGERNVTLDMLRRNIAIWTPQIQDG
ncbi:hypothetical protein V2J09_016283 [Rumex salicifolius]